MSAISARTHIAAPQNIGSVSAFSNARNVHIRDSSLNIVTNVGTDNRASSNDLLPDVFIQRVAPNAISNEGGRADAPKCHPGTREEVIGLIEKWMDNSHAERILWMSGPAGGGKTAIMKTIAERAKTRGVPTINFFFFRGDPSRKGIQPVVPTLLYQILQRHPDSVQHTIRTFEAHPRILDTVIFEQFTLISALTLLIRRSLPAGASCIFLVDGLDECDIDADRAQGDLLRALEGLTAQPESPFRLLLASRAEANIKMAFNELSTNARPIFLDETYSPETDIRRFVNAEFDRIKTSHPMARNLRPNWPSTDDVDEIIAKSSGQFIFAATVMRYLAHPSTSPRLSLERVKGLVIVPPTSNSPFAHLDSMYTFVLARATDQEVLCDILSVGILGADIGTDQRNILQLYNPRYSREVVDSCIAEITSIVDFGLDESINVSIRFYHASFTDFLCNKSRSEKYWVSKPQFTVKVLLALCNGSESGTAGHVLLRNQLLRRLKRPNPEVTDILLGCPLSMWTGELTGTEFNTCFLAAIHDLYYQNHLTTYKRVLCRAIYWMISRNLQLTTEISELPYAKRYIRWYRVLILLRRCTCRGHPEYPLNISEH